LYNVGFELLGAEKANSVEPNVVMVAGLIACMGQEYSRVKQLDCNDMSINYRDKVVSFLKNGTVVDTLEIKTEDFANPSVWLDRLYKEYNIQQ
jgi:hypothetical protein